MVPSIISISTWTFVGSISNAHTDVNTTLQRFLSVILYISDTQFKVLDILTDMSISLGYQLLGFKLFTHHELNLEQAAGLFSWLPRCVSGGGSYLLPAMLSLTGCTPIRLHLFSKDSLVMVLMSKPFGGRPSSVAHLPHMLHIHIEEMICCELKKGHAVVIGSACIALIHIALVFTLLGAIVYFTHSHDPNAHVKDADAADQALAVDDGNVKGTDMADHTPTVNDSNIEGIDAADHVGIVRVTRYYLMVRHGKVTGQDPASKSTVSRDEP
ncbi:hypothetical protein BU17DRAFT_71697 [Hysterangium stoloniferum]|nr:hypothetical protein BU17DRAFT_71697 [Hysterangium stoloniferum]